MRECRHATSDKRVFFDAPQAFIVVSFMFATVGGARATLNAEARGHRGNRPISRPAELGMLR